MGTSQSCAFKKADDELQVVFVEVYAPGIPDSQQDFMTKDEIRKMAWEFLLSGQTKNVDREHDNRTFGAGIVESFIARDDDPTFIPGSWVVGIHVPDAMTWSMIKQGYINGVSLDGEGDRLPRDISLNMPDWLTGETTTDMNHSHAFVVRYGSSGEFLGGETDIVEGHKHEIVRGTVTEEADGHTHRFSFVEQIDGPTEG
jgi:hypothetical protein